MGQLFSKLRDFLIQFRDARIAALDGLVRRIDSVLQLRFAFVYNVQRIAGFLQRRFVRVHGGFQFGVLCSEPLHIGVCGFQLRLYRG